MKKHIIALILVVYSRLSFCLELEIKGIFIGMPKEQFQSIIGWPNPNFSIAGIQSKYKHIPIYFDYRDDKLDNLFFSFNSRDFERMLDAVSSKYPQIVCKNSVVKTAMSTSLTQTICELKDTRGVLNLRRFVNDINTSSLSLVSHEFMRNLEEKSKKDRSDI